MGRAVNDGFEFETAARIERPDATLGSLLPVDRLWAARFQGVTKRMARFSNVDIGAVESATMTLMVCTMLIESERSFAS